MVNIYLRFIVQTSHIHSLVQQIWLPTAGRHIARIDAARCRSDEANAPQKFVRKIHLLGHGLFETEPVTQNSVQFKALLNLFQQRSNGQIVKFEFLFDVVHERKFRFGMESNRKKQGVGESPYTAKAIGISGVICFGGHDL